MQTINKNITTLSSVFPEWEEISNRYNDILVNHKNIILDSAKRQEKEESLFWEEFAFELIITMLLAKQIPFEASVKDIQPLVRDLNGIEKEIDFRIRIKHKEIYFGVTHFYGRPKDLKKDKKQIDVDVYNIKRNGVLQSKEGKILSIRPQTEYLNRRIVVRVASEGKQKFGNDYIYIIFPKIDLGFGGGLDGISKEFTFSSNYEYRPVGITGLILIGEYVELTPECSSPQEDMLLIRTLSFNNCSNIMKTILLNFDMNLINMRLRNKQVRAILQNDSE